ncbi:helix-turn-helix domain-containing protein [Corynebacterium sp. TAE3-ERU16]|uniref:helix-turn-helix domain-containing protein n=1 Tax=Corynebacterium sp. TAE3-ERU16 TaxID=2849493 RepID=UPI001C440CA1|nr:helix-turn-helix transcriptional regulator [Corynebacterium sp. TAE3-ERU16]MBV7292328.1 helix-turn-helix domain-containing protein [Corynebacterium sp. TAE3-ERU16]
MTITEQWEPGRIIQTAREDTGLSKRQAAQRAGISESWWRQIESGYKRVDGEPVRANVPEKALVSAAVAVGADTQAVLAAAGYDEDNAPRITLREQVEIQLSALSERQLGLVHAYIEGITQGRGV